MAKEKEVTTGTSTRDEKRAKALAFINKEIGENVLLKYSDKPLVAIEAISTGIIGVDQALGVGGFPKGRIIEIYGPEASGKTQLTLLAIAECQKAGGSACFIDAEHALDPSFAVMNGVNMDELYISQPDNAEQALTVAELVAASGVFDLIVIDSVSALTPKAEIDGDMGQSHMGLQARLMSQALRKLTAVCNNSKTTIIFINQIRMKIGVMFGNPETTSGGNALKFYASVRLDVRKEGNIKEGDNIIGHKTKVKVVKNKVSPPFKEAHFENIYGVGVNREGEILDLAVDFGLVDKSGAWYSKDSERLGQGRDNTVAYLKSHPEVLASLDKELREHLVKK